MLPITASFRGPSRGRACPAQAAETPSVKIVMLNAQAVCEKVQPAWRTSIVWKKLHA